MPTVADIGESQLIARIRARAGAPPPFVRIGIGDDAAAMEPARGELEVITTDSLVEDVHFRRDWTGARAIGSKAVTVNLSDLAAMGARPRAILLSLMLPASLPLEDFDALIDGAIETATGAGAALVGGNIARTPGPLVVDVTALGSVGRRRVLTRSGGRAGDELYVTGTIGGAAAGLAILTAGAARGALGEEASTCVRRYERPEARLRYGRIVAASRSATACMDLSDGLADAARQIASASGTGVILQGEAIPLEPGAAEWLTRPEATGTSLDTALGGGEDYELLFAVPPRRRRAFLATARQCRPVPLTLVGRLTADRDLKRSTQGILTDLNFGFRHF